MQSGEALGQTRILGFTRKNRLKKDIIWVLGMVNYNQPRQYAEGTKIYKKGRSQTLQKITTPKLEENDQRRKKSRFSGEIRAG